MNCALSCYSNNCVMEEEGRRCPQFPRFTAAWKSAKKFFKERQTELYIAYRLILTILIIPACLAAIGSIVERIIYGTINRPNFSPPLMLYGGLIAAPFILIRWFWPKDKDNQLNKLEFVYYLLFSAGFLVAVIKTTVAGNQMFYTGQHIRTLLGGKNSETFMGVDSFDQVYSWLNSTLKTVYDDRRASSTWSKELPGRLVLNGPLRLIQYRVKPERCRGQLVSLVSATRCLDLGSQDMSKYSALNFSYHKAVARGAAGAARAAPLFQLFFFFFFFCRFSQAKKKKTL